MSINPLLLPVKKDEETLRITVLTNIIKMLYNRKWISESKLKSTIDSSINSSNDDNIYKINLDVSLSNLPTYDPSADDTVKKLDPDFNDKVVVVKIFPRKVTSIGKILVLVNFFETYKNYHKILIVESMAEKAKTLITNGKYSEVFDENFFLINLIDHTCSPKYEILTTDEANEFKKSYNLTNREMKIMFTNDPASLYFYLKKKQMVRIIRDSEITGKSVDYRIVVNGKN